MNAIYALCGDNVHPSARFCLSVCYVISAAVNCSSDSNEICYRRSLQTLVKKYEFCEYRISVGHSLLKSVNEFITYCQYLLTEFGETRYKRCM